MDPPIQTEYFLSGRSPPLPHPPSRSRSLLPQRGSTLSGSEDPSWPPSPPSNRCGSPSRSTMSAVHPLSTGSASKSYILFLQCSTLVSEAALCCYISMSKVKYITTFERKKKK